MSRLFLAGRADRTVAGLSGTAMVAGPGVDFSPEPAFIFTSDPAATRRVALVSGGGAGHEPMHGGFVGRGGLDAACPGEIFTSPHNRQIYAASVKVALPQGVVHIVKNYTGDVLNFAIAAERLRADGIEVEQVLVDDDWGSRDAGDVGRRGTAATVVVEKVLGAAADAGMSLADLAELGRSIVAHSRTIAVATEAHRSPGAGDRAFEVPDGTVEYGVGIHGEPARERIPSSDLPTLVDRMVDELVTDMVLPDGAVVLVNGLGGVGQLELVHIADAVAHTLSGRGIPVRSMVAGAYCTALDMRGVSLTVVAADPAWLDFWFAGHDTALPRPTEFSGSGQRPTVAGAARDTGGPSAWLVSLAQEGEDRRERFNALDQAAGDGDFGDNLMAGLSGAVALSAAGNDLGADIGALATAYLDEVGGSSGPLLGLIFGALAGRTRDAEPGDLPAALLDGFADALHAVHRAGGAERGDRTMIDALAGLIDHAAQRDQRLMDEPGVRAAITGAEATRDMTARRGRAAYVGERVLGHPDAGAVAVAWLMVELWAALESRDAAVLREDLDRLLE